MKRPHIRTLMIAVALVAAGFAMVYAALQRLDIHIHDTYIRFGSPP